MPDWLTIVAMASLSAVGACVLLVVLDILAGRRQRMPIMNLVWPLTVAYAGPVGLLMYAIVGRAPRDGGGPARQRPFWQSVLLSSTHCGAGCALGDVIGEWAVFFGKVTILGSTLAARYVLSFAAAYVLGIAFQFFPIRSMRRLPAGTALLEAIKADSLSLTAFQIGMYGWMAVDHFILFRGAADFRPDSPVYWLMMQVAMILGLATTYPANWLLVRHGVKQGM